VALVRERTIPTGRPPPTFADRGCRVVGVTDSHGRILGFLDRSHYYFFQAASQLYSRGRVDPVPHSLFLRKSGSAGTSEFVTRNSWPLDHRGDQDAKHCQLIKEQNVKSRCYVRHTYWKVPSCPHEQCATSLCGPCHIPRTPPGQKTHLAPPYLH
jgi:hypothetical protein